MSETEGKLVEAFSVSGLGRITHSECVCQVVMCMCMVYMWYRCSVYGVYVLLLFVCVSAGYRT